MYIFGTPNHIFWLNLQKMMATHREVLLNAIAKRITIAKSTPKRKIPFEGSAEQFPLSTDPFILLHVISFLHVANDVLNLGYTCFSFYKTVRNNRALTGKKVVVEPSIFKKVLLRENQGKFNLLALLGTMDALCVEGHTLSHISFRQVFNLKFDIQQKPLIKAIKICDVSLALKDIKMLAQNFEILSLDKCVLYDFDRPLDSESLDKTMVTEDLHNGCSILSSLSLSDISFVVSDQFFMTQTNVFQGAKYLALNLPHHNREFLALLDNRFKSEQKCLILSTGSCLSVIQDIR